MFCGRLEWQIAPGPQSEKGANGNPSNMAQDMCTYKHGKRKHEWYEDWKKCPSAYGQRIHWRQYDLVRFDGNIKIYSGKPGDFSSVLLDDNMWHKGRVYVVQCVHATHNTTYLQILDERYIGWVPVWNRRNLNYDGVVCKVNDKSLQHILGSPKDE